MKRCMRSHVSSSTSLHFHSKTPPSAHTEYTSFPSLEKYAPNTPER